jgi:thiol-disulfide isomerase/thioredoxin
MNKQIPAPIFIGAILLSIVAALWIAGKATPTVSHDHALVGKPAPQFAGPTAAGAMFRSADQQGKVVLVNFWATWCGPCRMEIPDLIALQERYGMRGFTVVGLSADREGGMQVVKPFVQQNRINYPILLAPEGISEAFGGVPALPTSFLIDRNGTVRFAFQGLASGELLAREIEKLL